MSPITTSRLWLEPLLESHAREMLPVLSDSKIYDFLDADAPASLDLLCTRFRQLETRRSPDGTEHWLNWIVRLTTGPAAGYVQATVYPDKTAAIAFILHSQYWGHGYGSEAAQGMLGYLVSQHAVSTAFATTDARNLRSRRLLQTLGFCEVQPEAFPHFEALATDMVFVRECRLPPL